MLNGLQTTYEQQFAGKQEEYSKVSIQIYWEVAAEEQKLKQDLVASFQDEIK
jgi:hypothetical protein